MNARERWLGLATLLGAAVEHGSVAVERIHMATARRPFALIERIPVFAVPAQLVHQVHDTLVTNTYKQIRFWNSAVQQVVHLALADAPKTPEAHDPV
jgi:hypothetical protein